MKKLRHILPDVRLFAQWIKRQRTPEVQVAAIRALFAAVSADVRRHFDIRENDDFTIDPVVLELTPPGRRLWTRVMRLIAQRNEEIFGCLSAAEQRQLAALLDRVLDHARPGARA